MNYRHGFHAGNFADVVKHALLVRLLLYQARKEAPFRVIDTHAGEGAYDLSSDEAARTGEWRDGIGRLADLSAPEGPGAPAGASDAGRALLAPYLDCVGRFDGAGRPRLYPGSPLIAQRLMRAQDRAILCELRPDAFAALRRRFARDARIKTIEIDGYVGLGGFAPPKERRGIVLIDPPFERADEFDAMFYALRNAYKKWPNGIYVLWRPSKDARAELRWREAFQAGSITNVLDVSLDVGGSGEGLRAAGLTIINPPYVFEEESRAILAFLVPRLARGEGAGFQIEWLNGSEGQGAPAQADL